MCFPPVDTQMESLKSLLSSLFSFPLPFSFPSPLALQLWPGVHDIQVSPSPTPAALQPAALTGGWSSRRMGENVPPGVKGAKLQHSWMSAEHTLI